MKQPQENKSSNAKRDNKGWKSKDARVKPASEIVAVMTRRMKSHTGRYTNEAYTVTTRQAGENRTATVSFHKVGEQTETFDFDKKFDKQVAIAAVAQYAAKAQAAKEEAESTIESINEANNA
jgi:hypothetical protein